MANIFISYKREDKKAAAMLADRLEHSGWTVWWDHDLLGGEDYDERILKELTKADCVIVIWSSLSIHSRNVKDEARKAVNRNVLIPVSFDNSEPPIGFGMTHVISFQSKSRLTVQEFEKLRESVAIKVAPGDTPPPPPPAPSLPKKYILAAAILVVALLVYIYWPGGSYKKPQDATLGNTTESGTSSATESIIDSSQKEEVKSNNTKKEEIRPDNTKKEEVKPDNTKKEESKFEPPQIVPDQEPTVNLPEAEQLTNSLLNAMKKRDVEAIVSMSSTPYFRDHNILTSPEDIRSAFQSMFQSMGNNPFPEIKSIKVRKVIEWKKLGDLNDNDRILKSLNIGDDDYYAGVTFDKDGLAIAFRMVNGKLKVAGIWD